MSVPDLLRPKSAAFKRGIGALYLVAAGVLTAICWRIMGAGVDGSFGLDGRETLETSSLEIRGSLLLLVVPGILIAMFTLLGLRMVITGQVGGETEATNEPTAHP